jgi:hypothetical protein
MSNSLISSILESFGAWRKLLISVHQIVLVEGGIIICHVSSNSCGAAGSHCSQSSQSSCSTTTGRCRICASWLCSKTEKLLQTVVRKCCWWCVVRGVLSAVCCWHSAVLFTHHDSVGQNSNINFTSIAITVYVKRNASLGPMIPFARFDTPTDHYSIGMYHDRSSVCT